MPKRIKHQKLSTDVNQLAYDVARQSTKEPGISDSPLASSILSQYMAAIGRKGGKIGGKRRLTTMTAKERKSVARKAARARWRKNRKKGQGVSI